MAVIMNTMSVRPMIASPAEPDTDIITESELYKTIAENIIKVRINSALYHNQFCEKVGIDINQLVIAQNGVNCSAFLYVVYKIARIMETDISSLFVKDGIELNYKPYKRSLSIIRKRSGMTQKDAAKCLGIQASTLSRYENDKLEVPFDIIQKMYSLYDVPDICEIYHG